MLSTYQEQNKEFFFAWRRKLEMHLPSRYTVVVCLISITLGVYFYYSFEHEIKENPTQHLESFKRVVVQMTEYTYTKNNEKLMSSYNFISKNLLALDEPHTLNIHMEKHKGAAPVKQLDNSGVFSIFLTRCLLLVLMLLIGILLHRVAFYSKLQKLLESYKITAIMRNSQTLSTKQGTIVVSLGLFFVLLVTGQLLLYLFILIILAAIVLLVKTIDICFIKVSSFKRILDRCNVTILNTAAASLVVLLLMEFPLLCLMFTGFVIILVGWYMFIFGRQQKVSNDLEKRYPDMLDVMDVLKIHTDLKTEQLSDQAMMFGLKLVIHDTNCGFKLTYDYLFDKQYNSERINPTDIIFIAFLRSTPIMKLILTAKLLMGKLAIPFAFPVSMSTKRKIIFCPPVCTDSTGCTDDCSFKVVSFLRVDGLSVSKSKLINDMLAKDHNTFYSATVKSSRKECEGIIEAAWYEPTDKKETNLFDDVTLVLNLRGDGEQEIEQTDLLLKISSVNVIMIDLSNLKNKRFKVFDKIRKHKNVTTVLLVQNDCNTDSSQVEKIVEEHFKGFRRFGFVILNTQENSREKVLAKLRDQLICLLKQCDQLSIKEIIHKCGSIDLDNVGGNIKTVKDSADLIFKEMFERQKDRQLPLQGQHWKDMTKLFKGLYQKPECSLDDKDKTRNDMMKLRQLQTKRILENIGTLKDFAVSCKDELFVLWFKFFLCNRGQTVSSDSITFNNVCREMGLTYETLHEYEGENEDERRSISDLLKQLTVTSAEMFLRGHGFEIMDGDVGNIPMTWVTAVFNELTSMIQTKKLLVLSVIGNEPSAKSALLNALFGCPFLLSDTRGVSMQLKQVGDKTIPENIWNILVIDIQSKNMASDIYNESIKLAVGLGDILLVNIDTRSEVETVLQTAIQALQLIKKAHSPFEMRKTCFCIGHESTTKNVKQTIDAFFAQHADMVDALHFSSFPSDVSSLKEAILESPEQKKTGISIQDFGHKIIDLWTGLVTCDNEKFIIYFQKRLENRIYMRLAQQYETETWKLRKHVSDFVARKIQKCVTWSNTMTTDKISQIINRLKSEIENQEKKIADALESCIEKTFGESVKLPCKDSFIAKLKRVSSDLTQNAEKTVESSIKRIHQQAENEKDINAKISKLAKLARKENTVLDNILTQVFEDRFWMPWKTQSCFEDDKSSILHLFKCLARIEHGEVIPAAYFRSGITRTILFHVSTVLKNYAEKEKESILDTFAYSKFHLMKDIMKDLAKKDVFENYKEYINDPDTFAKKWITEIVNTKCPNVPVLVGGIVDKLSHILKAITISDLPNNHEGTLILIDRFVRRVNEPVNRTDSDSTLNLFISKDYFAHMEDRHISSIKKLKELLLEQLEEFKKDFKYKPKASWTEKVVSDLMTVLWGCTAKCMFCKEPCIYTDKDHLNEITEEQIKRCHSCIQHRPVGIGGWRTNDHLNVNFCNRLLKTETTYSIPNSQKYRPFKDYKTDYDDWDISSTEEQSKYWIWVLIQYKKELAEMHGCKEPVNIPDDWSVSKQAALDSLS